MSKEKQPHPTAKSANTAPIPSVDEIYKQRTAIDALALEISNDEKLFNEANAEKKKQLRELKTALANSIRQTNTALQQLAVPVTIEVQPSPEPFVDPITISDVESIPAPVIPSITVPSPPPLIPEPVPVIPNPVVATPNYKPFYIIIGILICLVFFVARCDNRPTPNPGPDPAPNPKPSPIIITKADEIIKAVNAASLTYNEKIVEATRRLTMEVGMEREAAYQYATEKITKVTNDDLSDSISAFPLLDNGIMQDFTAITLPNLPSLPFASLDFLEKKKYRWTHPPLLDPVLDSEILPDLSVESGVSADPLPPFLSASPTPLVIRASPIDNPHNDPISECDIQTEQPVSESVSSLPEKAHEPPAPQQEGVGKYIGCDFSSITFPDMRSILCVRY